MIPNHKYKTTLCKNFKESNINRYKLSIRLKMSLCTWTTRTKKTWRCKIISLYLKICLLRTINNKDILNKIKIKNIKKHIAITKLNYVSTFKRDVVKIQIIVHMLMGKMKFE